MSLFKLGPYRRRCAHCGTLLTIGEQRWWDGEWLCVVHYQYARNRASNLPDRPPDYRP